MVTCPLPAPAGDQPTPCQLTTAERLEGQCRVRQITCATCGGAWSLAAAAAADPRGDAVPAAAGEQPLEPLPTGPAVPPGPTDPS